MEQAPSAADAQEQQPMLPAIAALREKRRLAHQAFQPREFVWLQNMQNRPSSTASGGSAAGSP